MEKNKITVVIPVYNEEKNIKILYDQLKNVLTDLENDHEIIFIDDGSYDGSYEEMCKLAENDENLKLIKFRRNFGQTSALSAGFHAASGDIIVTLDADLQNDPNDIPALLSKIDEGYDVVSGWRKDRKDPFLSRRLPSQIANLLIAIITGIKVRDAGCTLKAMRKEIVNDIHLYGEMHRFIPILAQWRGAQITEIPVNHLPRKFGETKYGISRTFRVILDLITVKFLLKYFMSPIQIFGLLGLFCLFGSFIAGAITVIMKFVSNVDMTGNPFLYLTILGIIIGVQFIVLGLLGEISVRIYYETQNKPTYTVRETVNLD